eukprot:9041057-Karenia_brevis.AAC.1
MSCGPEWASTSSKSLEAKWPRMSINRECQSRHPTQNKLAGQVALVCKGLSLGPHSGPGDPFRTPDP